MADRKHNVSLYRAIHDLRKGGLHRALDIPEDKPIPADRLALARHSDSDHIRRMADFAHTMSNFQH